jgi:hypothetical protein
MRSKLITFITLWVFIFSVPFLAYGQSAERAEPKNSSKSRVSSDALPFQTRVFEIKHRNPEALAKALRSLSSDEDGAKMVPDKEFKTITVRDYPENIVVMERAINRLDVPEQPEANLRVQLHLIAASQDSADKSQLPKELEPIANELQSTLHYNNYRLISTFINQIKVGGFLDATGYMNPISPITEDRPDLKASYRYVINGIKLNADSTGKEVLDIERINVSVQSPTYNVSKTGAPKVDRVDFNISTQLSLREGEMTVIGTAGAGASNMAVIVVLSITKIK